MGRAAYQRPSQQPAVRREALCRSSRGASSAQDSGSTCAEPAGPVRRGLPDVLPRPRAIPQDPGERLRLSAPPRLPPLGGPRGPGGSIRHERPSPGEARGRAPRRGRPPGPALEALSAHLPANGQPVPEVGQSGGRGGPGARCGTASQPAEEFPRGLVQGTDSGDGGGSRDRTRPPHHPAARRHRDASG